MSALPAAPIRSWRHPLVLGPLVAAALCALYLGVTRPIRPGTGAFALEVFMAPADAGFEFRVRAPSNGYLALLAREPSGKVTLLHSDQGLRAKVFSPREPLGLAPLPLADGTQIWAVFGRDAFPVEWAVSGLSAGRELEPLKPTGTQLTHLDLRADLLQSR